MKKLTALILSILMVFGLCTQALAATPDADSTSTSASDVQQPMDSETLKGRNYVLAFTSFLQYLKLIDIDEDMNEIRDFFYTHDFDADYEAGIEPTLQLTEKQLYAIVFYVFENVASRQIEYDRDGNEVSSYWFYDYAPYGSLVFFFDSDGELEISMFQSSYWYMVRAEF